MSVFKHFPSFLWDAFCISTIIGIYPRFIEPSFLKISKYIYKNSKVTHPFSVLHLSDLHIAPHTSWAFLKKILKNAKKLQPDLIFLTGDFFCCSQITPEDKLSFFLKELNTLFPLQKTDPKIFAVLGNHDYEKFVSITNTGLYDVIEKTKAPILKGFQRLFKTICLKKETTAKAHSLKPHPELMALLEKAHIPVLLNENIQTEVRGQKLYIVGCEEYMCGKIEQEKAFQSIGPEALTLLLLHNPDGIQKVKEMPFSVAFTGHTHGGQINLPFFRKKFSLLEEKKYLKGRISLGKENQTLFVSCGLGSVLPFRWFSRPEMIYLSFQGALP